MPRELISSDNFIGLFITLKQLKHLQENHDVNLLSSNWSFNITDLKEFIFHSKKDYRYSELLICFNFGFVNNIPYSTELVLSLNRAMSKHLLTGIYDNIAYISRYYTNFRVVDENSEFASIMQDFITSFEDFCTDKESYLKSSEAFLNTAEGNIADNSRMILDLQRRIVKLPEDKDE